MIKILKENKDDIPVAELIKELKKFGVTVTENPKKRITKSMTGLALIGDAYLIKGKGWSSKIDTSLDGLIDPATFKLMLDYAEEFRTGTPAGVGQMWGKRK